MLSALQLFIMVAFDASGAIDSVSLLESRLSELNRIPLDVGGGGDCFFRSSSSRNFNVPYHINCMAMLTTIFTYVSFSRVLPTSQVGL